VLAANLKGYLRLAVIIILGNLASPSASAKAGPSKDYLTTNDAGTPLVYRSNSYHVIEIPYRTELSSTHIDPVRLKLRDQSQDQT